jgi:hypothetical protein
MNNMYGQTEAWLYTNPLAKRPRLDSAASLPIYPQRPGEKDCTHYMQTRTCKFGDSCRFDHPIWVPEGGIPDWKEVLFDSTIESLPQRPREPDCAFFLKTQKCKYGVRCRFNHPKDKVAALGGLEEVDPSLLPERPTEPPCDFYMKTGQCKFGSTCKFHHPKNILIPLAAQTGASIGQYGTTADFDPTKPLFTPAYFHNSKGLPVRPGDVDCPFYLKTGSCKYGATCRYNHPDLHAAFNPLLTGAAAYVTSPPAHLSIGVANPQPSILQTLDSRLAQATIPMVPAIYPQRPGQMECDFYMKTGECKFGVTCKYHHPMDRTVSAIDPYQQSVTLTLAGLPRREGSVRCPYYMKNGACKYGATCKFDHPPAGELLGATTHA